MARLKPDTIGIRYPATVVCYIDGGNEVFAASTNWIEAIDEAVKSSDRNRILPYMSQRLTRQFPLEAEGGFRAVLSSVKWPSCFSKSPNDGVERRRESAD